MCRQPIPAHLRRSAQPAVPFRFERPDRAPHIRDLVEGASQTHGRREHVSKTLPVMGSQFKQNQAWNVKRLEAYACRNHCGIVISLLCRTVPTMPKAFSSSTSFLQGSPSPLVQTCPSPSASAFEL